MRFVCVPSKSEVYISLSPVVLQKPGGGAAAGVGGGGHLEAEEPDIRFRPLTSVGEPVQYIFQYVVCIGIDYILSPAVLSYCGSFFMSLVVEDFTW